MRVNNNGWAGWPQERRLVDMTMQELRDMGGRIQVS